MIFKNAPRHGGGNLVMPAGIRGGADSCFSSIEVSHAGGELFSVKMTHAGW